MAHVHPNEKPSTGRKLPSAAAGGANSRAWADRVKAADAKSVQAKAESHELTKQRAEVARLEQLADFFHHDVEMAAGYKAVAADAREELDVLLEKAASPDVTKAVGTDLGKAVRESIRDGRHVWTAVADLRAEIADQGRPIGMPAAARPTPPQEKAAGSADLPIADLLKADRFDRLSREAPDAGTAEAYRAKANELRSGSR